MCISIFHTCNTGVIYKDDLFQQDSGRRVQDAVDCPEEGGPSLIMEDYNYTGGGQGGTATKLPLDTPGSQNTKTDSEIECVRVRGISDEIESHSRSCRAT